MSHKSKRYIKVKNEVKPESYHVDAAIALIKKSCTAKFKETIELCVMLGIDAKKTEQAVRGAVVLPHGSGKTIRIAVFAHGNDAETAKAAGADIVGYEDLAEKIKKGELNFDFVIATPDAMKLVGQLGQILGPRGLMPNPKTGSVTTDLANAIKNAKSGQVKFKTEKNGIIHCLVGKSDFDDIKIKDNMLAILAELKKNRPSAAKGIYFKKIFISSTMGPGITVDASSVVV